MRLSDKAIAKLQVLYQQVFDQEISKEDARVRGLKLTELVGQIYKPLTRGELERYQPKDDGNPNITK
jgi:hypothetical protein